MDKLLAIYLNDQLAAGVLWREIARRSQRSNRGTDAGEALADVAAAIADDVATFERIMQRLGVRRSRVKPALALAAERAGRLKPNGRLASYSPLSRFEELEFLVTVEGPFSAATLPGSLDEAGRLVLLRRLVREGFLRRSASGA